MKFPPLLAPFAWLAAGAFLLWAYGVATTMPQKPAKAGVRQASVAATVSAGPTSTVSIIDGNQLVTLDIPSADTSGAFVMSQRCYVWRDLGLMNSSITCPHQPEIRIDTDHSFAERDTPTR